jgi:hypothetical protein
MPTLNPLQRQFLEKFQNASDQELIAAFNKETRNQGWTNARAAYLWALEASFIQRGWDYSAIVPDKNHINLSHEVTLNGIKLELTGNPVRMI